MAQSPAGRFPFLRLPAELRLQIYAELSSALHSHVHYTFTTEPRDRRRVRTHRHDVLCASTDSVLPQLCTTPVFSGMQSPRNRGSGKHQCRDEEAFALRAVCRLIYAETQGVFEATTAERLRSISVLTDTACSVLNCFNKVERDNVRRITLWGQRFDPIHMKETAEWLGSNLYRLPSLDSFALQGPVESFRFQTRRKQNSARFSPHLRWRELPYVKKLERLCDGRITLIIEAWTCLRPGHKYYEGSEDRDEMVMVRGIVWSVKERIGCLGGMVPCTVKRLEVLDDGTNAQWKDWWEGPGYAYEHF
jgi:hypothetical protein